MSERPAEHLLALLMIVVLCSAFGLGAQQGTSEDEPLEGVRRAVAAVGLILVRDNQSALRPRGSAVTVRKDRLIATNYHVIASEKTGQLYSEIFFSPASSEGSAPAELYRLKVELVSADYDLALLRAISDSSGQPLGPDFSLPAVELGDSRAVKLLEDIFIIGFPEKGGQTVTVNKGVVEGKDLLGNWIKTDARLIRGNSGGAAVNARGQLIGIPTKILADVQPVDLDRDGLPDTTRTLGVIGYLRPAHLVAEMMAQLDSSNAQNLPLKQRPILVKPEVTLIVRGIVRSAVDGKPIAGAVIGLTLQDKEITPENLLAWGATNPDGQFRLNNSVPAGKYKLKARAIGYQPLTKEVDIDQNAMPIIIELRPIQ
jgi:S1-C subfamily serine protease